MFGNAHLINKKNIVQHRGKQGQKYSWLNKGNYWKKKASSFLPRFHAIKREREREGGREKQRFSSLSRKLPVQGEVERPNQRCIGAEWTFSLKQVFSLLHSRIRPNDMMTLLVYFHWMWSLTVLPKRTIFRTGSSCMNFLFVRNHSLSHSQVCEKSWGWIVKLFAGVASCLQWGFTTLTNNFWGKLSIWCGWWWELFMCCGASVIPWWGENSQLMI